MIRLEDDSLGLVAADDWERIKRIGLLKAVKTPDDYKEKVAKGMKIAYGLIGKSQDPVPSILFIQKLHYHTFQEVHPFAGELRPKGVELQVGGMACVGSAVIKKELTILTKEMKSEPFFGPEKYVSEVIAYYHSAFEAIHPFLDGNGRIGRMIMYHQMKLGLGLKKEVSLLRSDYMSSLKQATNTGDLQPLSKLLLRASKTPRLGKGLER